MSKIGKGFEDDITKCVECFKAFFDVGQSNCPYCKFPIWKYLKIRINKS